MPNCPNCKRNTWLEFDKGHYCKNCEYIKSKQKHQINKKILRQDQDFSSRLNYAKSKIGEIYISIANFSEDDNIENLQFIKGRIKLKFYKNISDYYKEMKNKHFQSNKIDPFSENAKGIGKIYQYEDDYYDYIDINIFIITPNHYIGRKNDVLSNLV